MDFYINFITMEKVKTYICNYPSGTMMPCDRDDAELFVKHEDYLKLQQDYHELKGKIESINKKYWEIRIERNELRNEYMDYSNGHLESNTVLKKIKSYDLVLSLIENLFNDDL